MGGSEKTQRELKNERGKRVVYEEGESKQDGKLPLHSIISFLSHLMSTSLPVISFHPSIHSPSAVRIKADQTRKNIFEIRCQDCL